MRNLVRMLGCLAILALLPGCVGRNPPAEFFMLEPESRATAPEQAMPPVKGTWRPVIAVGPVRIAKYLDRPQIVTALGKNAYKMDEHHRWAERLDDNIGRVLARNLEVLAPNEQVLASVPDRRQPVDFQVAVNVLEFHIEPDGQALLSAQWSIRHDAETLLTQTSSIRASASTTDYGRMVSALNECLNRLSHIIADTLRSLSPPVPRPR
jgi:uncharacterized lipoprotein YmbA